MKPSTPPFKTVIFDLFWPCPATFGKQFSEENSWNQLNNWKISSLLNLLLKPDNVIIKGARKGGGKGEEGSTNMFCKECIIPITETTVESGAKYHKPNPT